VLRLVPFACMPSPIPRQVAWNLFARTIPSASAFPRIGGGSAPQLLTYRKVDWIGMQLKHQMVWEELVRFVYHHVAAGYKKNAPEYRLKKESGPGSRCRITCKWMQRNTNDNECEIAISLQTRQWIFHRPTQPKPVFDVLRCRSKI
jgi:hypothetical protein